MNTTQATMIKTDEEQIREVVDQLRLAWNRGDGDAYAASFLDDADYVVWNGITVKGRAAIAEGHQRIFDTMYRGSTNHLAVRSVRFLGSDVAVVHCSAYLTQADGSQQSHGTLPLFVMQKLAGAWKIAAFQNTPIIEEPQAAQDS